MGELVAVNFSALFFFAPSREGDGSPPRLAKRGLRVRLSGKIGNPNCIGARLRLGTLTALGPATEVRSGGGYRSQDASVRVLALGDETPARLQVTWPSGKKTTTVIQKGATEITVEEPIQ